MPRRLRSLSAFVLAAVVLGACSSDSTKANSSSSPSGAVTVFGAASLTEAFQDLQTTLKSERPGLSITYNFGGSGALVTQIEQGAPADVIATADPASMQKLVDGGQVETPITFAENRLEILVAPGNPHDIRGVSDLSNRSIKVVLCDDTVPAGKYAAQALTTAGVTVSPVSKEADVKSAVAKVTSGEADATIVYQTDVAAAGSKGQGVVIPDNQNVIATYPIAIVQGAKNHDAAAAFVDAVIRGPGHTALIERGFLPPT